MINKAYACSSAIAMAIFSTSASAQTVAPSNGQATNAVPKADSAPVGIADIIVTANRQAQNLQRTPIAVTAVSGEMIQSNAVTKPEDLNRVAPSLQITQGAGAFSNFNLRGISSFTANAFSDPAISVNYDGVPIGRASGSRGFYYDLERVEVLKGPQGTLYGRNASAGVISFIPRGAKLDEFEADLLAEVGNYGLVRFEGGVNVPITSTLAARIAFNSVRHDGYLSDGTSDQDDQGVRLKLLWTPASWLRFNLGMDYARDGGKGAVAPYFLVNGNHLTPLTGDKWAGPQDSKTLAAVSAFRSARAYDNRLNDSWKGINLQVDADTPIGTLTLLPAYRRTKIDTKGETGGFQINYYGITEQKSLEARLASDHDGALRYMIGGFFFDETIDDNPNYDALTQLSAQSNYLTTKAYAAFGRLTWAVSDDFRITGGVRYTTEKRSVDATSQTRLVTPGGIITLPLSPSTGSATFKNTTWRIAADWDLTPTNFLYASVETGFKAGGFYTVPVSTLAPSGALTFQPEKITAFTVGSKNRFLDNRLQINLEAFYYIFNNQQFTHRTIFQAPGSNAGLIVNATDNMGRQKIRGAEIAADYLLTENTRLSATIQWIDGKVGAFRYTSAAPVTAGSLCRDLGRDPSVTVSRFIVDCTGNPLISAPKWTGNIGAHQNFPLSTGASVTLDASTYFRKGMWTAQEYLPAQRVPGYASIDPTLGYHAPDDRWSLELWGRNLTNKLVLNNPVRDILSSFANPNTKLWTSTVLPPRTYGLRLRVKFQ